MDVHSGFPYAVAMIKGSFRHLFLCLNMQCGHNSETTLDRIHKLLCLYKVS